MTKGNADAPARGDEYQPADDERLKELILYICRKSEGDESFGATKLNKLLFFSDFGAYFLLGKSLTGHKYRRLDNGPVPYYLPAIREELINEERLFVHEVPYHYYKQHKHISLAQPNLKLFTGEEIALVGEVIEHFHYTSATSISLFSHDFLGWRVAATNEIIPYDLVYLSNRALTEGEHRRAEALEDLALKYLNA